MCENEVEPGAINLLFIFRVDLPTWLHWLEHNTLNVVHILHGLVPQPNMKAAAVPFNSPVGSLLSQPGPRHYNSRLGSQWVI